MRLTLVGALATLAMTMVVSACGDAPPPKSAPSATSPESVAPPAVSPSLVSAPWTVADGVDVAALDPSANACTDFYQYACGGWIKANEIPADRPLWARTFFVLHAEVQDRLRAILEKSGSEGDLAKAHDYYEACLDEAAVEKADTRPLAPYFAKIDAMTDDASFMRTLAWFHLRGVPMYFSVEIGPDARDATENIVQLSQVKLTLPDRDYYHHGAKQPIQPDIVDHALPAHVRKMSELLGLRGDKVDGWMRPTFVEAELANASLPAAARRDPVATYHKMSIEEMHRRYAPGVPWKEYFDALGVGDAPVNLESVEYFGLVSGIFTKWKDFLPYMRWQVVHHFASKLPKRFVDENFAFEKLLSGQPVNLPRDKRCIAEVERAMPEAIAPSFVKDTPGDRGKADARAMVDAIEDAMRGNLSDVGWMDDPSKSAAREKIAKVRNAIGYPDKWRSYAALKVAPRRYLDDAVNAFELELRRRLAEVGKPVDRSEWLDPPTSVDAYYNAQQNRMIFPAGILEPPFFAAAARPAVSFGAIGTVMGHELTHGFDDEGRQFDGDGNLRSWWTPASVAAYEKRAACVEKQFDAYTVLDGVHLNGKLELGENLADLGGVKLAYTAMVRASAASDAGGAHPKEQAFFVSYGQLWCAKFRDEALRRYVQTNPHAPLNYRVNGPLSNFPPFAAAFGCKEGSPMARPAADRCEVW